MTITDDEQNPKPVKNLAKSLDAIAALRAAMEQRLAHEHVSDDAPPPKPEPEVAQRQAEQKPEQPAPKPEQQSSSAGHAAPPPKPESVASPHANDPSPTDPSQWPRILFRIADRVQKLAQDFAARHQQGLQAEAISLDPAHISEAFAELTNRILKSPERFAEAQLALWRGYLHLWQHTLERTQGKHSKPVVPHANNDKRFHDHDWHDVWVFDFIRQSYLLTAQWANKVVHHEARRIDPQAARKVEFYTKQMIDAMSPSNFVLTNPEVLRATMESGGENLIKGFENLLEDFERGHGTLKIRMTDESAFEVGKNIATTHGQVVYQNALMQLIQYSPTTEKVAKAPLLIIPPWINKFYILDLREKNSFIRYMVDQGHTVFCISWINPDARHALTNFEDYMSDGALTALRTIKQLTGEDNVNVLGYCIGGTLLASMMAWLEGVNPRPTDIPKVASATYLVTMVDFNEPGDIGVFIDEDQVKAIEARMAQRGFLDADAMATTFNMLRANDLIWSFVVNNYLLGKDPFPFDMLYWNADSTNLPVVMHSYYLRKMYMSNKLVQPDGLTMKGVPLDLRRITTPSFLLATHDDHIAPWKSTYEATQLYQGSVKFVLAGSGHIAGVMNHPANNKYGYWVHDALPADADVWLEQAKQHSGSWWPEWMKWLKDYSGGEIPARAPLGGIEPAPGSYVKVRAR